MHFVFAKTTCRVILSHLTEEYTTYIHEYTYLPNIMLALSHTTRPQWSLASHLDSTVDGGLARRVSRVSVSPFGQPAGNTSRASLVTRAADPKISGVVFEPFSAVESELATTQKAPSSASYGRTDFHPECEAAINEQINIEYNVSYVYHAMYTYFARDNVGALLQTWSTSFVFHAVSYVRRCARPSRPSHVIPHTLYLTFHLAHLTRQV